MMLKTKYGVRISKVATLGEPDAVYHASNLGERKTIKQELGKISAEVSRLL
jgi:hypothetical protein